MHKSSTFLDRIQLYEVTLCNSGSNSDRHLAKKYYNQRQCKQMLNVSPTNTIATGNMVFQDCKSFAILLPKYPISKISDY